MTYLTADQLGIKGWEFNQLSMLVDRLPTIPLLSNNDDSFEEVVGTHFSMEWPHIVSKCGSVSCIGGFIYAAESGIGGIANPTIASQYVYQDRSEPLQNLFQVEAAQEDMVCDYGTVTPDQAVIAIKNFLSSGDPKWNEILTKEQFIPI